MRHLEGMGVEYGTGWIVDHLLGENLEPVKYDDGYLENYIDSTEGVNATVNIPLLGDVDAVEAFKRYASDTDKRCLLADLENSDAVDGQVVSFDGEDTFYNTWEVEKFIEDNLSK